MMVVVIRVYIRRACIGVRGLVCDGADDCDSDFVIDFRNPESHVKMQFFWAKRSLFPAPGAVLEAMNPTEGAGLWEER